MSAVELSRITFRYPAADHDVLREVSLTAEARQVTWLFGPLGAGASTLLLVAAGLAPGLTGGTLAGEVKVWGHRISTREGRAALQGRVAYVTATPHLQLSGMASSVFDEVAFAPANLGWPRERIEAAVPGALARLGISHLADRAPDRLSGGELQRVVLAAMLVLEPVAWFLDEPTSALDGEGRALVRALLAAEAARGAAVLLATEDAELGLAVAHEMVLLTEGSAVARGAPDDLLGTELMWAIGAGSTGVAELARLAALRGPVRHPRLRPPYPLTFEAAVERWR
ncbi:MAG TPA: energy-coupling factor ABC transporter ATP-binding protein [Gemmatimonadales bacterium]|nr:energy-coupling factor ABC transporter ATP-binding protein [Gemmatimonadales bacterium]